MDGDDVFLLAVVEQTLQCLIEEGGPVGDLPCILVDRLVDKAGIATDEAGDLQQPLGPELRALRRRRAHLRRGRRRGRE